jgi:predicted secreted protein
MVLTCGKCARVNPPEAAYCFFDGFALGGAARNKGPVAVGRAFFPSPFVFPSGHTCRSFDEMTLACQEEWATARDLLRQGYLESFLRAIGRDDLARAARDAARFPDADRGLNQLLERLPSTVLEPPRLRVAPQEINLGLVSAGVDRQFVLHLENQGMRLLHGKVSCRDCPWLALGAGPGGFEKFLQFTHEMDLPVRVRGDRLQASLRPLIGSLLIETNAGTINVPVRAEVLVQPFPSGVLAGAKSPRQVAEKARANPKEAAILFEKGTVAAWYKSNGWTYPVQGPAATGLGAVQQFFEALGLAPPPKVQVSESFIALEGNVGETLRHVVEVRTEEKRPIFAHAASNKPWLEVGRPHLKGRTVAIQLAVAAVPNRPGETLTAQLTVRANGNQRFVIPVSLAVGGFRIGPATSVSPPPVAEFAQLVPQEVRPSGNRRQGNGRSTWVHVLPALLLLLALAGVVSWELAQDSPSADSPSAGPLPKETARNRDTEGEGETPWVYQLRDSAPRLGVQFSEDPTAKDQMRFGLVMLGVPDPRNPDRFKRLTFAEMGESNNTIVKIGDYSYYFGRETPHNRWVKGKKKQPLPGQRKGWLSTMEFTAEKVVVTQHVEIVPGHSGLLDTCLIYYTIHNKAEVPRKIGLRVMLDTFIGSNDGVPFTIPGEKGFLDTKRDFAQKEIPDYVEVIEKPETPEDLGTVARLGLKGLKLPGVNLEEIDWMRICRWPGNKDAPWEWEPEAMNQPPDQARDSCVALYWAYRDVDPGEKRALAFTYGLSELSIGAGTTQESRMALSVPAQVQPGREFVVTAYVWNAREGQKVRLRLPEGLSLVEGQQEEQTVEATAARGQVFWKVRAADKGTFEMEATSGAARARGQVKVRSTLFG